MVLISRNAIGTLKKSSAWIALVSLLLLALFLAPGFSHVRTRGPAKDMRIALTLDDGPNPPYSERFADLLSRNGIRATFFFIGRNIQMHRAAALRVVERGHEIGNHSYSHQRLSFAAPWHIRADLDETDALIRSLGYRGVIAFRAPFGERFGLHAWTLLFLGRTNTLYDVEPLPPDYFRSNPVTMAESAQKRLRPGSILLFHDGEGIRAESLEAVARLIPRLKAQGYRFVALSELWD